MTMPLMPAPLDPRDPNVTDNVITSSPVTDTPSQPPATLSMEAGRFIKTLRRQAVQAYNNRTYQLATDIAEEELMDDNCPSGATVRETLDWAIKSNWRRNPDAD